MWSKRGLFVIIGCLMMVLSSGWTIAEGAAPKQPTAVMEGADFNFGSVPAGKDVLHDFVIKNTGNAMLRIESVKTS